MSNIVMKDALQENRKYFVVVGCISKDNVPCNLCVVVTKENNFYAVWKTTYKRSSDSSLMDCELIKISNKWEYIIEYAIDYKRDLLVEYEKQFV